MTIVVTKLEKAKKVDKSYQLHHIPSSKHPQNAIDSSGLNRQEGASYPYSRHGQLSNLGERDISDRGLLHSTASRPETLIHHAFQEEEEEEALHVLNMLNLRAPATVSDERSREGSSSTSSNTSKNTSKLSTPPTNIGNMYYQPPYFVVTASNDILIYSTLDMNRLRRRRLFQERKERYQSQNGDIEAEEERVFTNVNEDETSNPSYSFEESDPFVRRDPDHFDDNARQEDEQGGRRAWGMVRRVSPHSYKSSEPSNADSLNEEESEDQLNVENERKERSGWKKPIQPNPYLASTDHSSSSKLSEPNRQSSDADKIQRLLKEQDRSRVKHVLEHQEELDPLICLKAHKSEITKILLFNNSKFNTILVSSCSEKIIMWNLDQIASGELSNGIILSQGLGDIVALDCINQVLAIALTDCILIFDSSRMSMVTEIQLSCAVRDCKFLRLQLDSLSCAGEGGEISRGSHDLGRRTTTPSRVTSTDRKKTLGSTSRSKSVTSNISQSKTKFSTTNGTQPKSLQGKGVTDTSGSSEAIPSSLDPRNQIVVAGGDGTISIWDWRSGDKLWHSPKETGFGFTPACFSLDPRYPRRLSIACQDGVVKIYEYNIHQSSNATLKRPFFKHILSLPELFRSYVKYFGLDPLSGERKLGNIVQDFQPTANSNLPIWKQQSDYLRKVASSNTASSISMDELKETLNTIIFTQHLQSYSRSLLVIGSPRAVFLLDMQSNDVLYVVDQGNDQHAFNYSCATDFENDEEILRLYISYDDRIFGVDIRLTKLFGIPEGGSFPPMEEALQLKNTSSSRSLPRESQCESHSRVRRGERTQVQSKGTSLSIRREPSEPVYAQGLSMEQMDSNSDFPSIFSDGKLPPKLLVEFNSSSSSSKASTSKIKDKPITFHNRIKSSGYGNEKPFGYLGKSKKSSNPSKVKPSPKKVSSRVLVAAKDYPVNSNPPVNDVGFKKQAHNAPILSMTLSYDGQKIATSSSDNTARIFRFPLSKSEPSCFMSHSNAVTDVKWSLSKKYIVTSSLDCKAILWSVERTEPILPFSYVTQNYSKEGSLSAMPQFKHPVKNAQFFFEDRFIALCTSNVLSLYRYHIAPVEKDHILQKGVNRNRYKVILNYKSDAQTFSALSCVNSFHSNLIFLGGSNRSLQVLDVTKEKPVKLVEDAHSRPITRIILNESPAENQGSVSNPHQIFATQAPDESIRIWDLRAPKCVRQFNAHKNSIQSIGGSFSPCMRYFACGSEDRNAYVYDFGSGTVISKLQGHSETVVDALFHPLKPMIITASFDNTIKLFTV